ncbi:hypothetical protein PN478_16975 [Dolichospermum circinale CS-534/05]|uniref:hypothetical protein n=1 Tax=Dolichospermum circinale TaxID=109265 RepID=UPI00232D7A7E|nr:hypothetical protein [Dolichospermum circinale]MDB9467790.1 hypothetical protein [Dolichospermum circinale CS-539/09]MDB9472422.1 hypothetical protein [Dolichospermum circinale CS-539]MDB9492201.1 hypothetical protein [Dolichospermum circinale CS-534/05]
MNIKQRVNMTFCAAILILSMPVFMPNLVFANSHYLKDSKQETTINLNEDDLKENLLLKINTANNFSGNIKLNGKNIKKIEGNSTEISLLKLLKKGKNIIEINGIDKSIGSTLRVELIGGNTQISQESGGNGDIQHILVIYVP